MPRIIDRLDAAVGRTPAELDLHIDYTRQVPSPAALISAEGTYNAGWFERFDGVYNFADSSAFTMALNRFFHVTLDTPHHYLVWNIADFGRAGNVALQVVDKATGRFEAVSLTRLLRQNQVTITDDQRTFVDPATRSFIEEDEARGELRFSMHTEHLHLTGVMERDVGPQLVQCTRFHRGRGSLQWYGVARLKFGALTVGNEVILLPPGCLGTTDRTVGHQRGLQGWYWLASAGAAVHEGTGRVVSLGVQIHRDHPDRARPAVRSMKYAVWLDGQLRKLPDATFEPGVKDDETRESGPWRVLNPSGQGDGVELTFTPRFHRRETKTAWLIDADFNQYYGEVAGTLVLDGERWRVPPTFAVMEDSRLEM